MHNRSYIDKPSLEDLYAPVLSDFERVNHFILEQLNSQTALIQEIDSHVFQAGGKRLRPLLVLLSAKACHYDHDQHIMLAAVIEFLHTATLLHDDVVDSSSMRRGRQTANFLWGNAPSILVGDFIYSRAFQVMVKMKNLEVMDVLSSATNVIAEGEVMQLANAGNINTTSQQYMDIIYRKTARLFEASSHAAAILAGADKKVSTALQHYGKHLGMAFQLIDDALDYNGNASIMGKNTGDDLAEGKMTLPLIYAMQKSTSKDATFLKTAIETTDKSQLEKIVRIVHDSGAFEHTIATAKNHINQALDALDILPDTSYKHTLKQLAYFSIDREK